MFNKVLAVVEFVHNGQSVAGSNLRGVTLDVNFIVVVIGIVAAMRSPRKNTILC